MEVRRCMKCMHELAAGQTICPECGRTYGSAEAESFALKPGTILDGKYLVGEMLGQGGFGITYIGFDLLLEQKVAIKEYFPLSTGMVSRESSSTVVWSSAMIGKTGTQKGFDSFLKEARKMAKLGGISGVVGVRSVFIQNETAYIVMDFIEGETLLKKLQREGPMEFDDCLSMLAPVIQAMAEVHKHGIIHRDISPDNIMVKKDGRLVLLDLGAAKDIDIQGSGGTVQSSQMVAKHGFSPVEQYGQAGKTGTWTDVYAMAATVYYCCTGVLPPSATDRTIDDTLSCKPRLTQNQFDAISLCMSVLPKNRPQDMGAMLQILGSAAGSAKADPAAVHTPAPEQPVSPAPKDETVRPTEPVDQPECQQVVPIPGEDVKTRLELTFEEAASGCEKEVAAQRIENCTNCNGTGSADGVTEICSRCRGAGQVRSVQTQSAVVCPTCGGRGKVIKNPCITCRGKGKVRKNNRFKIRVPAGVETGQSIRVRGEGSVGANGGANGNLMVELFASAKPAAQPENHQPESVKKPAAAAASTAVETNEKRPRFGTAPTVIAIIILLLLGLLWSYETQDGAVCVMAKPDFTSATSEYAYFWGQGRYTRRTVETVNFWSTMAGVPSDAWTWDVSEAGDGSVIAWMDGNDLYVAADGKIALNPDSSYLFGQFTNLRKIHWGEAVDTSRVTDMKGMFFGCRSLASLNLSSFNTNNVVNMRGMFSGCSSLTSLDINSFNVSNVTEAGYIYMFFGCDKLTDLQCSDSRILKAYESR